MPLDPVEPGAMPIATMSVTKEQVRRLAQIVEEYLAERPLDSVRLEKLKDAWLRVVFIGPDGEPVKEGLLGPV